MESADFIIIKSNHDIQMLMNSRRTRWLKERIRKTHLANMETRNALRASIGERLKVVFLAHLSGECNNMAIVANEINSLKKSIEQRGKFVDWKWIICPRHESSTIVRYDDNLVLEGGMSSENMEEHEYTKVLTLEEYISLKGVDRTSPTQVLPEYNAIDEYF